MTRKLRRDVEALQSAKVTYALIDGQQYFAETPKAWEIWTDSPLPRRVRYIPKQRILRESLFKPGRDPVTGKDVISK